MDRLTTAEQCVLGQIASDESLTLGPRDDRLGVAAMLAKKGLVQITQHAMALTSTVTLTGNGIAYCRQHLRQRGPEDTCAPSEPDEDRLDTVAKMTVEAANAMLTGQESTALTMALRGMLLLVQELRAVRDKEG